MKIPFLGGENQFNLVGVDELYLFTAAVRENLSLGKDLSLIGLNGLEKQFSSFFCLGMTIFLPATVAQ